MALKKKETFSSASFFMLCILHNVIGKQKWLSALGLFPWKPCFDFGGTATRFFVEKLTLSLQHKGSGSVAEKKKTGRCIVLKVAFSRMKVEQKGNSALQKKSKCWSETQMRPRSRVIETEVKQKGTDSHDGESFTVLAKSASLSIHFPLPQCSKLSLLHRSVG